MKNYEHCHGFMYQIREGDTLYLISRRYGVPLAELMRANPYANVYRLIPGEMLCIPMKPGKPPMPPMHGNPQPPVMPIPPQPPMNENPQPPMMPMPPMPPVNENPQPPMIPMPPMPPVHERPQNPGHCCPNGMIAYVVEEEQSVAEILERFHMTMEEFVSSNSPKHMICKPGDVIHVRPWVMDE